MPWTGTCMRAPSITVSIRAQVPNPGKQGRSAVCTPEALAPSCIRAETASRLYLHEQRRGLHVCGIKPARKPSSAFTTLLNTSANPRSQIHVQEAAGRWAGVHNYLYKQPFARVEAVERRPPHQVCG